MKEKNRSFNGKLRVETIPLGFFCPHSTSVIRQPKNPLSITERTGLIKAYNVRYWTSKPKVTMPIASWELGYAVTSN